jgi:hypothetical protein
MLIVVALGFVAAGCGGVASEKSPTGSAAPAATGLLPAPPVQAVDRPADPDALSVPDERTSSTYEICQAQLAVGGTGPTPPEPAGPEESGGDCKLTPEEEAKIRAQERTYEEAIAPAPGTKPRTVAELRLGGGRRIELAAWGTGKDKLCLEATAWEGTTGASGGVFGECAPGFPDCTPSLCAEELPRAYDASRGADNGWLVAVVAAGADRIEITTGSGERRAYPLAGPLVPGFDRRVFMVDLGDRLERAVDLYRGEERIGHTEKGARMLAFEICSRAVAPPPMGREPSGDELRSWNERFEACVREHGDDGPQTTTTG